jgi:hypothetical protein
VEEVVEPPRPDASPLIRLASADDDAQGQELAVHWDYELDRRIPEEEAWTDLAATGFDQPRQFAAFLHTLRWNCVTPTDPNLFQAPFRAGIKVDAYQMEPLRKALRLPRVNLFIADDTGLGKTIEAALIARELLLRKKAKHSVVAAPPSVLEQWKGELEDRFGLVFEILDRSYVARVRRERGFGVNPWRTHSRFLVSHNLLGDATYADPMREWLGPLLPGSLLILDEALLQRPHLRPARARSEPGAELAARRGVPRLHTRRGDLLRDAQRLPGPRPRRPRARPARRGLLRARVMDDAFISLPANERHRLVRALDAGLLELPCTEAAVRSAVGGQAPAAAIAAGLNELAAQGVSARGCAATLRAVAAADERHHKPDFVWSGPEVPGLHARDTRRVYEELFQGAESPVWVSSNAYFDGAKAFAVLAERMDAIEGLEATLCLNIQRKHGDTTSSDDLVRRFADKFWSKDWRARLTRGSSAIPGHWSSAGPGACSTRRRWWPTESRSSSRRPTSRRRPGTGTSRSACASATALVPRHWCATSRG